MAKATLGEMGGGDTHGSLFGSTRNPYALDRTVGGSSGGSGGAVAANFATVALGQEEVASIRRPASFIPLVGMRPSAGLASRSGVYNGWPTEAGSLGPMARSVKDLAAVLEVLVGYDPDDPITGSRVGKDSRKLLRLSGSGWFEGSPKLAFSVSRCVPGAGPRSEDFLKVSAVFDQAIEELRAAGAVLVDPVVIPDLQESLSKRVASPEAREAFEVYFSRKLQFPPFESREEAVASPVFAKIFPAAQRRLDRPAEDRADAASIHHEFLLAQDRLMTSLLAVMADHQLDAIVHKTVENQPAIIGDGKKSALSRLRGSHEFEHLFAVRSQHHGTGGIYKRRYSRWN